MSKPLDNPPSLPLTKCLSWDEAAAGDGGATATIPSGSRWILKHAFGYDTGFAPLNPFTGIRITFPGAYHESGGPGGQPFAAGVIILTLVKENWNDTGGVPVCPAWVEWNGELDLPPGTIIQMVDINVGIPANSLALQLIFEEYHL